MKRKRIVCLLLVGVLVLGLVGTFMWRRLCPLAYVDLEGCQIGVYDREGREIIAYLSDEDKDQLVLMLELAELDTFGTVRYPFVSGAQLITRYKIELQGGKTFDVGFSGDCLIIGGLGYKGKGYLIESMHRFWEQAYKEYYYSDAVVGDICDG
ncbi:MAG: hypothetical protein IKA06_03335 [Clostridia bacterium]|nr:hypothetical protein [Clostridia bacterium]